MEVQTNESTTSGLIQLQKVLEELEECVRCGICLDSFTDARILPACKHTFCLKCLHNMYRAKARPNILVCPSCKSESQLTPTDSENTMNSTNVDLLEKNKDLDNVAKVYRKIMKIMENDESVRSDLSKRTLVEDNVNNNNSSTFTLEKLGVPFRITANQAKNRFQNWLPQLETSPLDLPQSAFNIQLEQVYCPCYEFAVTANTTYNAKLFVMYNNSIHQISGDHGGQYSVLAYLSNELEAACRRALQSFKIDVLQDEDLAEFINRHNIRILSPDIDLATAKSEAEIQVNSLEREQTTTFLLDRYRGSASVTELVTSTTWVRSFQSERLFPLYLGSYVYGQKTYRFVVSGVTGEVYGEFPVSKMMETIKSFKSCGKFLVTVIVIVLFIWFLHIRQQELHSGHYQKYM